MFGRLHAWKKMLAKLVSPCPPIVRRHPARSRLNLEALEDRTLLSAVSVVSIKNGAEGGANGIFRLSRDDAAGALTVQYNVYDMGATNGVDYNLPGTSAENPCNGSVGFLDGETTVDIPVNVIDDTLVEWDEYVVLCLAEGSGCGEGAYTLGDPSSANLSIADNDVAALVWVESATNAREGVSAGAFHLKRDQSIGALTVSYNVYDMGEFNGRDFAYLAGTSASDPYHGIVKFLDGEDSVDITVDPRGSAYDDNLVEGAETVNVSLAEYSGCGEEAYTLGAHDSDTLTIADNDVAALVWIGSVTPAQEGGSAGAFHLKRDQSLGALTVKFAVWDLGATNGSDFAYLPGTDPMESTYGSVKFLDGQMGVDVPVNTIDDSKVEGDETVYFSLLSYCGCGEGAYALGAHDSGTLTIVENDVPTSVTIEAVSDAQEGGSLGRFRLTRDQTAGPLWVSYQVDWSSTASSGSDFAPLPGSVEFLADQATVDIFIDATGSPYDDTVVEQSKTVTLNLTEYCGCGEGAYTAVSPGSATITLTDNDVNHAPVAGNDGLYTVEHGINLSPSGSVLGNDTDSDGNSLTAVLASGPSHGTVTLNTDGSFSYQSTSDYIGSDSFTYQAYDEIDYSEEATVTIQVTNGGYATGRVWADVNSNGLQNNGETGLSGVTVNLLNNTGTTVLATTTTDANGIYNFSGLDPALQYAIQVVKPDGYAYTFYHTGSDTTIDSDTAASTNGTTVYFQVPAGYVVTLDSGMIPVRGLAANTFTGPGAVPGNSMYTYMVTFSGQPCVSWSITGAPASIIGDFRSTYDSTTDMTIKSFELTFSNSPADVIVAAIVNGEQVASKEVYVVQVTVDFGDSLSYIGGPADGGAFTFVDGIAYKLVASMGASWSASVTLTGPGNNLGVDQIQAGFVQHVNLQSWRGQYAPVNAGGQPQVLVANLEGRTFLDMGPDVGRAPLPNSTYTTRPWFDRQAGAMFTNATAANNSATISSADGPGMGAPVVFQQDTPANIVAAVNNNTYNNLYRGITNLSLIWNFTLDVAVATTDTSNGANNSVWGEYRANWTFNGTGTIGGPNTGWAWTGNGAYTGSDASWTAIGAPTEEDYGGQIMNQAGFSSLTFAPPN